LDFVNLRLNLYLEAGFISEKFPKCTSETIKARPFQRIQKYFSSRETTYLSDVSDAQFGNYLLEQKRQDRKVTFDLDSSSSAATEICGGSGSSTSILTSSFASTGSSTTTSCSGGGEKNIKK
jgi:hypothetical protein